MFPRKDTHKRTLEESKQATPLSAADKINALRNKIVEKELQYGTLQEQVLTLKKRQSAITKEMSALEDQIKAIEELDRSKKIVIKADDINYIDIMEHENELRPLLDVVRLIEHKFKIEGVTGEFSLSNSITSIIINDNSFRVNKKNKSSDRPATIRESEQVVDFFKSFDSNATIKTRHGMLPYLSETEINIAHNQLDKVIEALNVLPEPSPTHHATIHAMC